ncbi:MAG: hypothetical protein WBF36_05010 [Desulfobulbales bacterium]
MISKDLVGRLEEKRFAEPHQISDRGVIYLQHYDIGGGRPGGRAFLQPAGECLVFPTAPMACGTVMSRNA